MALFKSRFIEFISLKPLLTLFNHLVTLTGTMLNSQEEINNILQVLSLILFFLTLWFLLNIIFNFFMIFTLVYLVIVGR